MQTFVHEGRGQKDVRFCLVAAGCQSAAAPGWRNCESQGSKGLSRDMSAETLRMLAHCHLRDQSVAQSCLVKSTAYRLFDGQKHIPVKLHALKGRGGA